MHILAIIPARYASTRFPGKPLCIIDGKPMIQRVYERMASLLENVVIATDDIRIKNCVNGFGGKVVMTGGHHTSGTDRCMEALEKFSAQQQTTFDVVVNIQGDEPFVSLQQVEDLIQCFDDPNTQIATLIKPFEAQKHSLEELQNPNSPKVVVDQNQHALLFSRSVIPYLRGIDPTQWLEKHVFYKHIGLYAYRSEVLAEITQLAPSPLELSESLEQLRWLENGYKIKLAQTREESISIDTPQDLEYVIKLLTEQKIQL